MLVQGDPSAVPYAVETVQELLGQKPMFGICMGHQLLGQAFGGKTFKLKFGHHGGNHPVRHNASGALSVALCRWSFVIVNVTTGAVCHHAYLCYAAWLAICALLLSLHHCRFACIWAMCIAERLCIWASAYTEPFHHAYGPVHVDAHIAAKLA